ALAISDRIAIMNKGTIYQIEKPENIYSRPYHTFVASFIGHSNRFRATVTKAGTPCAVKLETGLSFEVFGVKPLKEGCELLAVVRPEEFIIHENNEGMVGTVVTKQFLGKCINYLVDFGTGNIMEVSSETNSAHKIYTPGEKMYVTVNDKRINLFDKDTQITLMEGVESHVV
ncbi:MAG: TOBE domain-containing protein, partial [Clostridia bacterium]